MEALNDWLRDVFGLVLAAIGGWATFVTVKLFKQSARLAVLETTITQIVANFPASIARVENAIKEHRAESSERASKLYERIESTRLELKGDIQRESDKRV